MSDQSTALPQGFEALSPFVEFWAADTAAGRAECRQVRTEADRKSFYLAARPLLPEALQYLDSKSLDALEESEQRLMQLVLSFAHIAMAEELHREKEAEHARDRHFLRITRAPADEAPA